MTVRSVSIPEGSLIETSLPRIDYEDTFEIEAPAPINIEDLPKVFFKVFPKWFTYLMGLRELIARGVGLKTASGMDIHRQLQDFTGKPGESIALFHVLGRSDTEILTGESDKHLDFRLSFLVYPEKNGMQIIQLCTVVQKHNWLGCVYFFFVKPFHRIIVPVLLRRIEKFLLKSK